MEAKVCTKCGVILCEKNWLLINGNIRTICKHCRKQRKYCCYTYSSKELEEQSKYNTKRIGRELYKRRNPEKVRERMKKWKKENRDKVAKYRKEYKKRYPEKHRECVKRCLIRNPEIHLRADRKNREQLRDRYIKGLIRGSPFLEIETKEIPQWYIEIKRKQIKAKRACRNEKQVQELLKQ